MKTIGIVAEYNPFHNGHEYHIQESRRCVAEDAIVIVVMSGDFVQRGEAAVFSKFARAEAACRCGADLVVELPLPWSVASAEHFASGAVKLLNAIGTDVLSFGSETGDIQPLLEIVSLLEERSFIDAVRRELRQTPQQGFAAARQKVAENVLGKELPIMQQPNNILAIEYLKAIHHEKAAMAPLAIRRKGSLHDQCSDGQFSSAYEIRKKIFDQAWNIDDVPSAASAIYLREIKQGRVTGNLLRQELVILSRLRFISESTYLNLPDSGEDLGKRLFRTVHEKSRYDEIIESAMTKRYSRSRIRRLCTSAYLGINRKDIIESPPYVRILAFNKKGRKILHERSEEIKMPILVKPSEVKNLSTEARRCFSLGADAHDMLGLLFSDQYSMKPGDDWRSGPVLCE